MATDKKISDLNPYAGGSRPADNDLFVSATEDSTNYKIPFSGLAQHSAERASSAFVTGDQTIGGIKTFDAFILGSVSGNLSGIARYVQDGVYVTGDQTIDGIKTFQEFILGNVSGNLSGTARYVQDGVYTTGNQTIDGVKTFQEFILGNVSGNLSGIARHVQDGVYTTGDQTIVGVKTFSEFVKGNVSGNLSGTAFEVLNGVYLTGDQTIGGNKLFSNPISGNLSGVARYVQDGVYLTGVQSIGGHKTFSNPISGNLSGEASQVTDGVYTTGHQTINGIKTFSEFIKGNVSGNLSGTAFEVLNGVYSTGNQDISGIKNFTEELLISGSPVLTLNNFGGSIKDVVYQTGAQLISGNKSFENSLIPLGGITSNQNKKAIGFTDGRDPNLFTGISGSLTLAFESDVYITGGVGGQKANLHVEGSIIADRIDSLEEIVGESGAMVFTDGRDPSLFEGPDKSLTMAFESDVYITGGVGGRKANLHVEGSIIADRIDSLEEIVGESGAMVFTDGRDPSLFEGPDKSLTMAFESDVYITGGVGGQKANLHVEGAVIADRIDSLDEIVGESGAMVFTDGRDPVLFDNPDKSLTLAFQSGVYISGEQGQQADLFVNGHATVSGLTVLGDFTIENQVVRDYIYVNFNQDSAKEFYIPLHVGEGTPQENNQTFVSQGHTILAPHNGRIKSILCRSRGGSQDPGDITFTVCTGHNDAIINPATDVFEIESVSINGCDRESVYEFDFSNSQHFDKGVVFLIKGNFNQVTTAEVTLTAHIEYTV